MTKYDVQKSNNEIISLCLEIAETSIDNLDRLETLYSKLDPILDLADRETVELVLNHPTFQENRDQLHTKRAHYEYDREKLLADEIIAEHNADVAEKFRRIGTTRHWILKQQRLRPISCKISYLSALAHFRHLLWPFYATIQPPRFPVWSAMRLRVKRRAKSLIFLV